MPTNSRKDQTSLENCIDTLRLELNKYKKCLLASNSNHLKEKMGIIEYFMEILSHDPPAKRIATFIKALVFNDGEIPKFLILDHDLPAVRLLKRISSTLSDRIELNINEHYLKHNLFSFKGRAVHESINEKMSEIKKKNKS